jgi:hypothetical protein
MLHSTDIVLTHDVVFRAHTHTHIHTYTHIYTHIYTLTHPVRYVEYTDGTFSTPKPIAPEWAHLGLLGPVLRGEVGDELVVHFKNKGTGAHKYSLHPHGVFYTKAHEGECMDR